MTNGIVSTIAGTGISGNADGSSPTFNHPKGIAFDNASNYLWVADYGVLPNELTLATKAQCSSLLRPAGNNAIRRIDLSNAGLTVTIAGGSSVAGSGVFYQDGVGTSARFNSPTGVAIGPTVNSIKSVYVADYGNNRCVVATDGAASRH